MNYQYGSNTNQPQISFSDQVSNENQIQYIIGQSSEVTPVSVDVSHKKPTYAAVVAINPLINGFSVNTSDGLFLQQQQQNLQFHQQQQQIRKHVNSEPSNESSLDQTDLSGSASVEDSQSNAQSISLQPQIFTSYNELQNVGQIRHNLERQQLNNNDLEKLGEQLKNALKPGLNEITQQKMAAILLQSGLVNPQQSISTYLNYFNPNEQNISPSDFTYTSNQATHPSHVTLISTNQISSKTQGQHVNILETQATKSTSYPTHYLVDNKEPSSKINNQSMSISSFATNLAPNAIQNQNQLTTRLSGIDQADSQNGIELINRPKNDLFNDASFNQAEQTNNFNFVDNMSINEKQMILNQQQNIQGTNRINLDDIFSR